MNYQKIQKVSKLTTIFILILFSLKTFGQLQRLSILPQENVIIKKDKSAEVKTIAIDYYREAPNAQNMENQEPYNQVYSISEVVVIIDGLRSSKSFQSLVQGESPFLLLKPSSNLQTSISLNQKNPETKQIKSIELEFRASSEIGNIKDDANVKQAQMIFQNWGYQLSQQDFFDRAKSLDILSKNNKLSFILNNQLTEASKVSCDKLFKTFDFSFFNGSSFKSLVDNNFIILDNNLDLTKESIRNLKYAYNYERGLDAAGAANLYSGNKDKNKQNENTTAAMINHRFKQAYYITSSRLTNVSKENPAIKDTLIDGSRYVLMVAWKSQSFNNYVSKDDNGSTVFKSSKPLFTYPLFITTRVDLENWYAKNNISSLNESQCRSRLMELLGLPPNSTNNMFVEFWINEHDLFRPCIDSSLNASMMLLKLSSDYVNLFSNYSKSSYSNSNLLQQYPFTGLGYTWDSNPGNKDHFGVSEFVLKESRTVFIRRIIPTMDYLKSLNMQK